MQLITLTSTDSIKFQKNFTDPFSLQRTKDCAILWLGAVVVCVQDITTRKPLLDVLQPLTIQNIDIGP